MPMGYANRFNLVHMYVEMTYNSFQGFILALLFCFLNEEVHSEIKRIWWRRRTRRRDSVATRSFVLSSFKRGSYHNNRTAINNVNHQHTTPNQQQPLNSSAHLSRSDSADVKQEAWSGRLKNNVLRLLRRGRSSERERGGTIRNSTSPFNLKDDCRMELSRIENNDDIDAPMRLEDSERNEDPTSSG
ncbi:uncharacterized protein LOC106011802 [Aplysia californica]|uniref:Uncharacterized protein LOC106011802 n=1 Tax=Aplysia californica TaxID=6500 RepID=A0ABM1A075_APLCA|nr:uncharacterized protein LOC106011802 [Aplysia californica]